MTSRSFFDRKVIAVSDSGHAIGEDHPLARYTDADVRAVLMLREAGFSLRAIAAKMDMPVRTVRGYISQRTRHCSVADFRVRKVCQEKQNSR